MQASEASLRRPLLAATGAYLLFVVYQSLAGAGIEACALPLSQQGARLSLADGVANFVAYLPLGMLVAACISGRRGRPPIPLLIGAFVAIAGFSLTMEALQACLVWRVSSWYDWATNSAGGLLGLLAPPLGARIAPESAGRYPVRTLRLYDEPLFWPTLLCVGAWLVLSLAPWRLTLDVGTLRANLSFLREFGTWPGQGGPARDAWKLLHHLGGWLAVGIALRAVWDGRRAATLVLALMLGVSLAGQVMLVRSSLSFPELLGMAGALGCSALLPSGIRGAVPARMLPRMLPLCSLVSVAAWQLAPQRGGWLVSDFHWWPQLGRGGLLSALESTLLFGGFAFALILSLRWAAARGVPLGRRPLAWSLLGALAMLLLEFAQRWIPGRIGDTSAPLMMLLAFLVGWTLTGATRGPASGRTRLQALKAPVPTTASRRAG